MKMFLLWFFAVLQVADGMTTLHILARGGKELNPAMRWIFEQIGTLNGVFITKTLLVIVFWMFYDYIPIWAFAAMCGLYAAVVYHNVNELRK